MYVSQKQSPSFLFMDRTLRTMDQLTETELHPPACLPAFGRNTGACVTEKVFAKLPVQRTVDWATVGPF
jgi:hypothetical protein